MAGNGTRYHGPWFRPDPQNEFHRVLLCRQLDFPYPPNHEGAYDAMVRWKSEAETLLDHNQFDEAFSLYTNCIYCTELFPDATSFAEERCKLLCKRSLVLTKLFNFREAENDARKAVVLNPNFVEAYWRVAEAVKGSHDGPAKALLCIVGGLQKVIQGHGTPADVIDFLTELCTLIPKTSSLGMEMRKDISMMLLDIGSDTWTQVLTHLSTSNAWQSVAMLTIGKHSGPSSMLDGIARSVSCTDVSVGSLLLQPRSKHLRDWGEELAVHLIRQGASVDEIGHVMFKPPVHVALEISLITGQHLLLQCVLEQYADSHVKKNAQTSNGSTALHALVRSGKASSNVGLATLQLLLQYDINPLIEDSNNKTPLDYIGQDETAYAELKKATKTVKELQKSLDGIKANAQDAITAGNLNDAVKYYDEALAICNKSMHFNKEKTTLYCKRANVFFKSKDYTEALSSSLTAIDHDTSVYKGHMLAGKSFVALDVHMEAFMTYIDGYTMSPRDDDAQVDFIMKAVVLLEQVRREQFMTCYSQLLFLNADHWPRVLGKLSVACKWKTMAYITLGPDIDKIEFQAELNDEMLMAQCVGVAKSASVEDVQLHTVFQYLDQNLLDECMSWLDALLLVMHFRGGQEIFKTLSQDYKENPIHVLLKYSFIRGPSLLRYLLDRYKHDSVKYSHLDPEQMDDNGDCLFHLIAKAKYSSTVMKVTEMLCNRNLSVNCYNKDGKLPVHYIALKDDRIPHFLKRAGSAEPTRAQANMPESYIIQKTVADHSQQLSVVRLIDDNSQTSSNDKYDNGVVHSQSPNTHTAQVDSESDTLILQSNIKKINAKSNAILDQKVTHQQTGDIKHEKVQSKGALDDDRNECKDCLETIDDMLTYSMDQSQASLPTPLICQQNSDHCSGIDTDMNSNGSDKVKIISTESETQTIGTNTYDKIEDVHKQRSVDDNTRGTNQGTYMYTNDSDSSGFRSTSTSVETLSKNVLQSTCVLLKDSVSCTRSTSLLTNESVSEEKDYETATKESKGAERQQNVEVTPEVGNRSVSCSTYNENGTENSTGQTFHKNVELSKVIHHKMGDGDVKEERELASEDARKLRKKTVETHVGDVGIKDKPEEQNADETIKEFDNLEWEVECTTDVLKTLKDKHVSHKLKLSILHKIKLLARGDWQPSLCKKLKQFTSSLKLYEAKINKSSRIIWELAIAFSPRLSKKGGIQSQTREVQKDITYSEIIRVWEIVLDHDKIHRSVEKIKRSHERGKQCIIQKNLWRIGGGEGKSPFTKQRYPQLFTEEGDELAVETPNQGNQCFFPPASDDDNEYHIRKFYAFSSAFATYILQNVDAKVDFPFKVTDLEHAIINLKAKAPILLIGRSGTGKTTCCLYRLWSQFHSFWSAAYRTEVLLQANCVQEKQCDFEDNLSEEGVKTGEDDLGACAAKCDSSDHQEKVVGRTDNLHQVFITKNSILCREVQKGFRELCHADEIMQEHVRHEGENLPSRLQDLHEYAFPLFLTSKQLLLMLDASIGRPHFFERNADGSLKGDITGWSDLDGPLSFLEVFGEDVDIKEAVDVCDIGIEEGAKPKATGKRKSVVNKRREITYLVFAEEIWPRIKKDMKNVYHPSLIWTEIMSFIKGSFEALSSRRGYLELDEYEDIGRKRAPNFDGKREVIYNCFKRYNQFKKKNSLFDETDLVHNLFQRLEGMTNAPWVINQIFVDEAQDFSQAELYLILRLCQNPNDMFLTGDTAQSIIRGISFRFMDLQSLFFHAKRSMQAMGKTTPIEVPKQVYQLTHNYRSHAGILALASSILELMVEFFPESFDRLQPDQGLLDGPMPVLLESCSSMELAEILMRNERETSRIEFGAHQAILVTCDTARDTIPEELRLGLVLTIYEAKGLEFDDVLIYNFFKDSQASKEWRIVTAYLDRLIAQRKKDKATAVNDIVVTLDEGMLGQKSTRARPLAFDPNAHKVLNSELKYLYTAVTRARVNVWIFDEDMEGRAPMFEYLKVLKLVRSINDERVSKSVFAEKSDRREWLQRGEDFMKRNQYQLAAKCFGNGNDDYKERIALAHHQALEASKQTDPSTRRAEYLTASRMYEDCNMIENAAVCLQKAGNKLQAAELFETFGQVKRAADIYRKLNKAIPSSRCYEQLGDFRTAIEVLYENEEYLTAIATLRRYNAIMQGDTESGQSVLFQNKPAYTEEHLKHSQADRLHRHNRVKDMLEAVEKFQTVDYQVEFLEKRSYNKEAVNCLKKHGLLEQAASLLLKHGMFEDSIVVAKKTLNRILVANHLLAGCRILMSNTMDDIDYKRAQTMVEEASRLFAASKDSDGFGQAKLLHAQLTKQIKYINQAWKAFSDSSPIRNEAGLFECANWLVTNKVHLNEKTNLQHVIDSIEHLSKVCKILLDTNPTHKQLETLKQVDRLYGIQAGINGMVVIHPLEKPLCQQRVSGNAKNKLNKKKSYLDLESVYLRKAMVSFLLYRSHTWSERVLDVLHKVRNREKLCDIHQAGLKCQNVRKSYSQCIHSHKPLTKDNIQRLVEIDILFVEHEQSLYDSFWLLNKSLPTDLYCLVDGNKHFNRRFQACQLLWDDIMPAFGHWELIADNSKGLIRHLRNNDKVLRRFKHYIEKSLDYPMKENNKSILNCRALRETEVFLLFEFGYHLFGFDHGKRRMAYGLSERMLKLERYLNPVDGNQQFTLSHKTCLEYTIIASHDKRTGHFYTKCIATAFVDAIQLMAKKTPYTFESVLKFNEFIEQLSMRLKLSLLPNIKTYLFWIEFYTVLAMLLIAKLKCSDFTDFWIILPSSYLNLVKFVEATFPSQGITILESIDCWKPHGDVHNKVKKLRESLKYYSFVVSGHAQGVHMMNEVLKFSINDPKNYCLVERLLVLAMTLVCNIGNTVPVECEMSLLRTMSRANIPAEGPERLAHVVQLIRESQGEADVAKALNWLIQERKNGDEVLLVNKWKSRSRNKIESIYQKKDVSLFATDFQNPSTLVNMHSTIPEFAEASVDVLTELDLTEEEIQKKRTDKQAEMARNKSARVIVRFFKRVRQLRKQTCGAAEVHGQASETDQLFTHVTVTTKWCGICGVSFEKKLEEESALGNQSVPKEPSGTTLSSSVWPTPSSPKHTKQQPFNLGIIKQNVFDNPDLKEKRLYTIRQRHEEGDEHQRKKDEFSRFKVWYKQKIQPKIDNFKEFLNNPDFMLTDKAYREQNYDRHLLEIDRVFAKCSLIEREIQLLVKSRMWSQWGRIDQTIIEVDTDLGNVRPYVVEVHAKLKKEEK